MLVYYKACAALLIFLIGIIGAAYPLKKRHVPRQTESIKLGESLASGIFLGATFFHMLPEAIQLCKNSLPHMTFPIAETICVFGFLLMLTLEGLSHSCSKLQSKHSIPYILALILIIHAITEGIALGMGATLAETSMLLIAILVHKASESFALCVTLLRHQLPTQHTIMILIFFALMTPLGIAGGATINLMTLIDNGQLLAGIFNAFAAGTFLYISTLHHAHFHDHEKDSRGLLELFSLLFGAFSMGLIALWT